VIVTHEAFSPGDPCPQCQQGTLYRSKDWGMKVRLAGQSPIGGTRYELERLRCGTCGKTVDGGPPPGHRLVFHRRVPCGREPWLTEQIDQRKVEPNSSLGEAIRYLLEHWEPLTLFLRRPGAPLDNNLCEQALKMAIRHRKNSLFYKTQRGADVGDIYMTLIHTCYFAGADPFDYLTQIQRQEQQVKADPARWLPWNYREQLVEH